MKFIEYTSHLYYTYKTDVNRIRHFARTIFFPHRDIVTVHKINKKSIDFRTRNSPPLQVYFHFTLEPTPLLTRDKAFKKTSSFRPSSNSINPEYTGAFDFSHHFEFTHVLFTFINE